jgi:hypothetical protein
MWPCGKGATFLNHRNVAFYCVADSEYFLGLVALLNSLRLVGHAQDLFVLDRGLNRDQRVRLEPHVILVEEPDDQHPTLSKYFAPLRSRAGVMVLLDSDMIVTRNLDPLIAKAVAGGVVAFADVIDRWFADWEQALDLPPLRRQTYVNSGFFAFSESVGVPLLEKVRESQRRIELQQSRFGGGTLDDPFFYPDQDSWNAILASSVPHEQMTILENRLAPFPPFAGVTIEDMDRVTCRDTRGEEPFLLHFIGEKPWLSPAPRSPYTRLMTRLLLGQDLTLRVGRREVPWRLRQGIVAEGAALVAGQRGKLGLRRALTRRLKTLTKSRYPAAR